MAGAVETGAGALMIRMQSEWVLSGLLLLVAAIVLTRMMPDTIAPVLRLDITKNRSEVRSLYQNRDPVATRQVLVDVLDLSRNGSLAHARLGDIGYREHFFVDLDKRFDVGRPGDYRLLVSSDDGFSIRIDGNEVCGYARDRLMGTQTCTVNLAAGEHRLQLRYFQSGGPAGLKVQYGRQGESRLYWLGESSRYWQFDDEPSA